MGVHPESWKPISDALGYADEREMLVDLYEKQELGVDVIAKTLGFSKNNVRRRLSMHGIKVRGRGGANNIGSHMLQGASDDELLHLRECAVKYDVHYSTVYKERRRREKLCNSVSSPQQSTDGSGLPSVVDAISSSPSIQESENTGTSTSNESELVTPSSSTTEHMKEPSSTTNT